MNTITFIIGGARSGKSSYALNLAQGKDSVVFIATAEALDVEMRQRILKHKNGRPAHWQTIEAPRDLWAACNQIHKKTTMVIIDCLTLWISNLLMVKKEATQIEQEMARILAELRGKKARVVIVANEVGLGIVPANKMARAFRDIAGKINQITAAEADEVIFMAAGLPMMVKPLKRLPALRRIGLKTLTRE